MLLENPNSFSNQSCAIFYLIDMYPFFHMQDALDTIRISKEDQMKLFSMLAAVLWLGNISFSVIDNENHVEVVSNEGTIPPYL